MTIFLTNLLFISICMGFLVLLLKITSSFFKKIYQIKIRQIIWILLSIRLIIPISAPISFFSFTKSDTNTENEINYTLTRTLNDNTTMTKLHIKNDTLYFMDSKPITRDKSGNAYSYSQRKPNKAATSDIKIVNIIYKLQYKIVFAFINTLNYINKHNNIIFNIYISGIIIFILYHLISLFIYNKKLSQTFIKSDEYTNNILTNTAKKINLKKIPKLYLSADITSPMVIGIVNPKIILPSCNFTDEHLQLALTHELFHIKHKDLIIKNIYFITNAIHWFNPLIYMLAEEAQKDMEMYCDYSVVKSFEKEQRMEYNCLLLNILELNSKRPKNIFFSTCMKGNSSEFKERFRHNLDLRKKNIGFVPLTISAMLVIIMSLLFSLNADVNFAALNKNISKNSNYSMILKNEFLTKKDNYQSQSETNEENYEINNENNISFYTEEYSMGDPNLIVKPKKNDDGSYMLPERLEDYYGNVTVQWSKSKNKGKPLTETPNPLFYINDTEISNYSVIQQNYESTDIENKTEKEFFRTQCSKDNEDQYFTVSSWKECDGYVRILFPADTVPEVVDVEDIVLNEDGTPRYSGMTDEIVYRATTINNELNMVSFQFANHSSIAMYEHTMPDYDETKKFFYRGFRITCHYSNENGIQSYTYYIVCKTNYINTEENYFERNELI